LPDDHLDWLVNLPISFRDRSRLYVHAGIRPGIKLALQQDDDLLWIREPFLSSSDAHELFVVHGHTPTVTRRPDLRPNRLNLDTGAGWDGPLTAAVFRKGEVRPFAFITEMGSLP
jgi:serine/threonine protein phosphatase 1